MESDEPHSSLEFQKELNYSNLSCSEPNTSSKKKNQIKQKKNWQPHATLFTEKPA